MIVALIGFMGSGKTTIGKALGEKLGQNWMDLDAYIEMKAQKRIPDLFKDEGEAYFRKLEQVCLKEVVELGSGIVSTGGGVITTPDNIEVLQSVCTIYLSYPFETLYHRIAGDGNRPLATSYEALEERFLKRLDLYEKASQVKIDCEAKSINQITEEIINYLERISKRMDDNE